MALTPPPWLNIDSDSYKRMLNRTAVTITKRAKKRGATYQVKEAIDAIHAAFHRCDGMDPYDGLPLESRLLAGNRCPSVSTLDNSNTTNFEVLSVETQAAKGERTTEDFIAHCRAVVAHADRTATPKR